MNKNTDIQIECCDYFSSETLRLGIDRAKSIAASSPNLQMLGLAAVGS